MNFDLVRPCEKCPFRKNIKSYLRKDRVVEIVAGLKNGQTFSCHETTDREDENSPVGRDEQFCAGALIMMENAGIAPDNQMIRICERLGFYDHENLDMEATVFDSFSEMVEAQDR